MEKKLCSKCNLIKNITEFNEDNKTKDGYRCWCKSCKSEYDRIYREKNFEKIKQYRLDNREKLKEKMKIWHQENKLKEKEYIIKTRDKKRKRDKLWYEKNIDKMREYHRQYKRKARMNELIYMQDRVRNMISHSFKRKGYTKKSKTYEILGAEYNIVLEHLKNTWYLNYGTKYNGEEYEIDHIKPLSLANTNEDVIKLCHYTNLQLLTPEDNLKKSNKIIK